jgi:hypothetical protein
MGRFPESVNRLLLRCNIKKINRAAFQFVDALNRQTDPPFADVIC